MLNYVYKTPFKNFFIGGWQAAGSAFVYSGLPFTVMDAATTSSLQWQRRRFYRNWR